MEVLLIAAITWAMGQQSEQAKLGLAPEHRAHMVEQQRHEKALRKIADKHGGVVPAPKTPAGVTAGAGVKTPATASFRAGYRTHVERTAPPLAHRAGDLAGRGTLWAKDTGRKAFKRLREKRAAQGRPDPAPVIEYPPMPTEPPTVGVERRDDEGDVRPGSTRETPPAGDASSSAPAERATATEAATEGTPAPAATPDTSGEPVSAEITYTKVYDTAESMERKSVRHMEAMERVAERAATLHGWADDLTAKLATVKAGHRLEAAVASAKEKLRVLAKLAEEYQDDCRDRAERFAVARQTLEANLGGIASAVRDSGGDIAERDYYNGDDAAPTLTDETVEAAA